MKDRHIIALGYEFRQNPKLFDILIKEMDKKKS